MASTKGKIFILSAPSGAGKSTLVRAALERFPMFAFSVSATTRPPREGEQDGVDYHFLSEDEFRKRIDSGDFLEWEEVYSGTYYGTLKSEVDRIRSEGKWPIFDVDVEGGLNIKRHYGQDAVAIFVQPPSLETLQQRLKKRGKDSPPEIERRVAKAREELAYADRFDQVVVNDDLDRALKHLFWIIETALSPAA